MESNKIEIYQLEDNKFQVLHDDRVDIMNLDEVMLLLSMPALKAKAEKEAAEAIGASNGSIGACCNHISGHKTVKDYIWLWEDEKEKIMDYVALLKISRRSIKIMQQVEQLSLNGEHIAFYPTAKAAAQALGYKRDSHIGDCCKGRRNSCFGYKWKYVID